MERWLRAPEVTDDKYSRGVLAVVCGSERYPGAAVLVTEAAARTGVGMVRVAGPVRVQDHVLHRRPEAVVSALGELGSSTAAVLGSGIDAEERNEQLLEEFAQLCDSGSPLVLDAGALDHAMRVRGRAFVTPHAGELARMLGWLGRAQDRADVVADPAPAALIVAEATGAVVVLKGHTTHVVAPDGITASVTASTTRLATAGAGDVLAGVLGGLLAQHAGCVEDWASAVDLAATAVRVHGQAAVAAGDQPLLALDVAEAVPSAIVSLAGASRS